MAEFLKKEKSLHRINNNTDTAGKMTNELDGIAVKTIQNQTCTHTQGLQKNEKGTNELWNFKEPYVRIIEVPKGEERDRKTEKNILRDNG